MCLDIRPVALRNYLNDHLAIKLEPFPIRATISLVHPQHPQVGKLRLRCIHYEAATFTIIDIGGMHHHFQYQPIGIDEEVALAPRNFLLSVQAAQPPFSVVLTD